MHQQLALEQLELNSFGKVVTCLSEALALDIFKNGSMDIYLGDEHYRIQNIWPVVNGIEISFGDIGRSRVLVFENGTWADSPRKTFDFHFSPVAPFIAIHDDHQKLCFVVFLGGYSGERPVRQVLYPAGREPKPGMHQIIGWRDDFNPIISRVV